MKIQAEQAVLGTAFFVARNVALTCAHVIENLDPAKIAISWSGQNGAASLMAGLDFGASDLVLLQLTGFKTPHPCVRLGTDTRSGDPCYAYGYSDVRPNGDPVTIDVEGNLAQEVKLKSGQIRFGLSGSPILNLRTGYVCGILRTTRDSDQDLGGFAISLKDTVALDLNRVSRVGMKQWERCRTDLLRIVHGKSGKLGLARQERDKSNGWWIYGLLGTRNDETVASVGYFRLRHKLNGRQGIIENGWVFRIDPLTGRLIEARGQWASRPFVVEQDKMTIVYTVKRRHLAAQAPRAYPSEHNSVMELVRQSREPLVGTECWEGLFQDIDKHRSDLSGFLVAESLSDEITTPEAAHAIIEANGARFIQLLRAALSS